MELTVGINMSTLKTTKIYLIADVWDPVLLGFSLRWESASPKINPIDSYTSSIPK